MSVPVIQAFTLGLLRLAAMGAAIWLYVAQPTNPTLATVALGLLGFAITGQAIDVLKVNRQITDARTITTVSLQQPADTPAPMQLAAKTESANPGAQP